MSYTLLVDNTIEAYIAPQQTYHVKEMLAPPPGGLDMNVADQDEFSPDKLRSSVERLYMTVVGTGEVAWKV